MVGRCRCKQDSCAERTHEIDSQRDRYRRLDELAAAWDRPVNQSSAPDRVEQGQGHAAVEHAVGLEVVTPDRPEMQASLVVQDVVPYELLKRPVEVACRWRRGLRAQVCSTLK